MLDFRVLFTLVLGMMGFLVAESVRCEDTNLITTAQLTVEKAEQLTADFKGWLSLNGVTSLTDSRIAAELAKHKGGGLVLDGVTNLSTDAAAALANYPGWLSLGGLTSLSSATAMELAKHQGPGLLLNGVASITNDVALKFSNHHGWLSLSGLRDQNGGGNGGGNSGGSAGNGKDKNGSGGGSSGSGGSGTGNSGGLDQSIAAALGSHPGPLSLNGITTMTPAVFGALVKNRSGGLDLSGLKTIQNGHSNHLRDCNGWIALDGLETLNANVISDIADHSPGVGLLGLKTVEGNQSVLRGNKKVRLPTSMR